MSRESRLEKAYKELQKSQTPDLWKRIEDNLEPKEEKAQREETDAFKRTGQKGEILTVPSRRGGVWWYKAGGAAAGFCVLFTALFLALTDHQGGKATMETRFPQEDAGGMEETAGEPAPEETAASDVKNSAKGESAPREEPAASGPPVFHTQGTAMEYQDLQVAGSAAVPPPQNAVYAAADSAYFTEDILGKIQLLCLAEVQSISYEPGKDGEVWNVIYDISVNQVLYSGDDQEGESSRLQVRSPLVEGEKGEPLYLMKEGGRYVLPLEGEGGDWKLSFAWAPQIEATQDGGYVFHTGWRSLADQNSVVVKAPPQAEDDFYFDRMIYRQDDEFLPSLIALTKALHNV